MSHLGQIVSQFFKGRFSLFLMALSFYFLGMPLIAPHFIVLGQVMDFFGLVVLASCLVAISRSRRFFIFMAIFTLFNLILGSCDVLIWSSPNFVTIVLVARLLYFLLVVVSILRYVLDSSPVTTDKIFGALSAYLLIGVVWAVIYSLFQHLEPGSFNLKEIEVVSRSTLSMWALYFSFTTLPSLGYGDITPQLPAVQSYAVMEAVFGQIFLTVLVARLVALQIMHSGEKGSSNVES